MTITWKCTVCGQVMRLPDAAAFPVHHCGKAHEYPDGVVSRRKTRDGVVATFVPEGPRPEPCSRRGGVTRVETCPTCAGGGVRIKVFACELHGECAVQQAVGRARACATCRDYTLAAPEPVAPAVSGVTAVRPPVDHWPKTLVVIGAYRGGTSFVAQALADIGVDMGPTYTPVVPGGDYVSYEDHELGLALDALGRLAPGDGESSDAAWGTITRLVQERDSRRATWGFKKPCSVHFVDRLLPLLRNPHLVVVMRDPVAAWQSDESRGGDINWQKARHHAAVVMDLLEKPRAPTLAVSYERAKEQPEHLRARLREFVGCRPQRNLLYHVCPLVTNDLWERNVEQLCRRMDLFDGRVHVAVATGEADLLHPLEAVRDKFRSLTDRVGIEYVPVRNDRRLREVASFRTLLERVNSRRGDQVTFYAHTKGNSTFDDVRGAIYWRNAMYHKLLDGWEQCMEHLREHAAVGCMKMDWSLVGRSIFPTRIENKHKWMFAGTFFWFRNDAVFGHDGWDKVQNDRYGAEAWLGDLFQTEECKSVFQPHPDTKFVGVSPYDPELYARHGMAIEDCELRTPAYSI